jgi:hypothetical protein
MVVTDSSDMNDVEMEEIEDNFQVGLTTSENDIQEKPSTTIEKQIVNVLRSELR